MNSPSDRRRILIPLSSALAFGLYPAATQLAYQDGANASYVIVVTTFARAIALVLFCIMLRKSLVPARGGWRPALSGGFFQTLSAIGLLSSLLFLPGPVTMTIFFTHTLLLLMFLVLRGEMKPSLPVTLTTISALIGVTLVVDLWHNITGIRWEGIALALLAALATMSRLYVYGKQVQVNEPAVVGAQVFTVAAFFTLSVALVSAPSGPTTAVGVIGIVLSCLSLIVGTFTMFYGIAAAGSIRYSLTIKIEPAFTAIFSWLVMNQTLGGLQYIGILAVVGSLMAFQIAENRSG